MNPRIGETVGLEIESDSTLSQSRFRASNFQRHGDASVESRVPVFYGKPVNLNNVGPEIKLERKRAGNEFVSVVLDSESEKFTPIIKNLCKTLIEMGDSSISERSGIHVHVSLPGVTLEILKSIVRLGRNLEQVFFLLGCMGYDFRGNSNDSIFCRPITKKGPLIARVGYRETGFAKSFHISHLLEAKSIEDFRIRYGNINRRNSRYVPVRYHWLNLKTLWDYGTLEFRVFNKTLNPLHIISIVEICKLFTKYAVGTSFKILKEDKFLGENSVFDIESKEPVVRRLQKFLELMDCRPDAFKTLMAIAEKSPVESLHTLNNEYVFCHLMFHAGGDRCPTLWQEEEYTPFYVNKSKVKKPVWKDSHNLANERKNNNYPRSKNERRPRKPGSDQPDFPQTDSSYIEGIFSSTDVYSDILERRRVSLRQRNSILNHLYRTIENAYERSDEEWNNLLTYLQDFSFSPTFTVLSSEYSVNELIENNHTSDFSIHNPRFETNFVINISHRFLDNVRSVVNLVYIMFALIEVNQNISDSVRNLFFNGGGDYYIGISERNGYMIRNNRLEVHFDSSIVRTRM